MKERRQKLSLMFKPILWSYDFPSMDPEKNRKAIIVNAINYGDLKHWKWLIKNYGRENVRNELKKAPAAELMQGARKLAFIVFYVKNFNYAP